MKWRPDQMNNFFKVMGLALAVHYIVKTVQKEFK